MFQTREAPVNDLILLAVMVAFFIICGLYARGCEKL